MNKCYYCDITATANCAFCSKLVCDGHNMGRIWAVCRDCYDLRRQLEDAADLLESRWSEFDPDTVEVLQGRLDSWKDRAYTPVDIANLLRELIEEE